MNTAEKIDLAYMRKIEEENEELRERIISLEEILGFRLEIPLVLGLTSSEARVLGFLMKRESATKHQIMDAVYSLRPNEVPEIKIVDVFICKIRRKVKDFDIEIETLWGQGYRLTPDAKEKIEGLMMKQNQTSAQRESALA